MIEIQSVSFSYDTADGKRQALTDVSLVLEPGRHVALLGGNGSGKSTLAKLCDGLLLPEDGRVVVDGLDTRDPATLWDVRARVGVVFQDPDNQIVGTVVEEDVAFAPENLGLPRDEIRRRVDDALRAVGLEELRRREPHRLSGGQKQRLAIAGVLAMRPEYVVFDEPTAMLDPRGRVAAVRMMEELRGTGRGILHITHDLTYLPSADQAIVLKAGRVVFRGTPAELLSRPELLHDAGLALPPIGLLAEELRARGVPVPADALTAEGVVDALWR